MRDARGTVLYVGKAQSLRQRVRQLLAEARRRRAAAAHRVGPGPRGGRRVHADRHRQRGPAARGEPHQAHQPRFNVRLKDDKSYPFIKVTLADDFPRIERTRKLPAGRQPLLRAVRLGEQRGRGDEPHPPALPLPDLHDRDPRGQAGAPATLPAVPHQALPGPLHRGHRQGRLPARHRTGDALPRGRPGAGRARAAGRDGGRLRERSTTSGRPPCATRCGPSSGRWRARRWPPSRAPSRTSSASPGPARRPPCSSSPSATGKTRGARRVPARERRRRSRTARRWRPSSSSTTRPPARSRRASWSRWRCPARTSWWPCSRRAEVGGSRSSRAAAWAEAARCLPSPRATRPRRWPGSRRAGWPTRARRSRRWTELADALGLPAPPHAHRVLRHQHHPGHQHRGQHGRLRGGPAADRRVPPLPGADRRRARTTSPATRRCSGAASGAPCGRRRGTRRSCAGGCRTS